MCLWLIISWLIARGGKYLLRIVELKGVHLLATSLPQVSGILIVRNYNSGVSALVLCLSRQVGVDVEIVKLKILDVLIVSVETLESLIKSDP